MIQLGCPFISFEPDRCIQNGNITRNFFDVSSQRICTMRNNGTLGLTSKRLDELKTINVRTKDRGEPSSIKFSPNGNLCMMQRTALSVDIIFLLKTENSVCLEMSIFAKSKEPLLAFEWVTNTQIILVTNHSAELVNINEDRRTSKVARHMNVNAAWAVFYAPSLILFIANGISCSNIQPIAVAQSQFTRLKNFEVEFGASNTRENLLEKDISIATIYGKLYLMVLRYSVKNASTTDLVLYEIPAESGAVPVFKYSLILGFTGGCGIHVFDNLVIVHHQSSATSYIFDIAISSFRVNHSPIVITAMECNPQIQPPPPLYSPYWFTFLPNIVIDSHTGVMYSVQLNNERAMLEIAEKSITLEYLSRRVNGRKIFMKCLLDCLKARSLTLRQIRNLFALLANKSSLVDKNKQIFSVRKYEKLQISQQEMQSAVLIPLRDDPEMNVNYVSDVMLQYLRSLYDNQIEVEAYLIELVVETLALAGDMEKLHQIVTYRVINDSNPLAFLLLRFGGRCSSLFQSAVDILARNKSRDAIVEVMLERNQIVDAFRFVDGRSEHVIPKILEKADEKCSLQMKYAIRDHLVERGVNASIFEEFKAEYNEEDVEKATEELSNCAIYEF